MGVEHSLVCKKCQSWVDGHKCWQAYFAVHEGIPETYKEVEKRDRPHFDLYWISRMFAFMWKHKDHGSEVVWTNDHDSETEALHFHAFENYLEEFNEEQK